MNTKLLPHWKELLDFEFADSTCCTLVVRTTKDDPSYGHQLLKKIKHLSRYMKVAFVKGFNQNGFIIQFDYDLYFDDKANTLFYSIYSYVYDEKIQTA